MILRIIASALLFPVFLHAETLLKDDFSKPKLEARRASRGEWKYADGIAKCTQDDELYKKFKDHGPIIFYDLPHADATIRFKFKAEGCKTLVFTGNGDEGHIFRFVASERGTSVRAFPPDGKAKSIEIGKAPALTQGQWVDVVVELRGTKASVKLGAADPIMVEHASLVRAKANLSIGFSFGTLSLRDVTVEK